MCAEAHVDHSAAAMRSGAGRRSCVCVEEAAWRQRAACVACEKASGSTHHSSGFELTAGRGHHKPSHPLPRISAHLGLFSARAYSLRSLAKCREESGANKHSLYKMPKAHFLRCKCSLCERP